MLKALYAHQIVPLAQFQTAGLVAKLHNVISEEIAAGLIERGISMPKDKVPMLGEGFSKLAEYNRALDACCFFADSSLADALWAWKSHLSPFRQNILQSSEYFSNMEALSGDYAILGAGAFIKENLALEMPTNTAEKLAGHLKVAAEIKAELRLRPAHDALAKLAENASYVLEAYRKTLEFREDFRRQIQFTAEAYGVTSHIGRTMVYFLNAPLNSH